MKSSYIKYKHMTQSVIDFCGKENIVQEVHQSSGVMGYFLADHIVSPFTTFKEGLFIIKDSLGNIHLNTYNPVHMRDNYIYKPVDSTHVDQNFGFYRINGYYTEVWTGYEWEPCSFMSMVDCKTILKEL